MSDPKGFLIPLPVKSSFREGLSVLEYFISTHGARKGLADTALRTADSGYLTRRMIDVAQDVIVLSEDCETMSGIWVRHDYEKERSNSIASFAERLVGRVVCSPIADPNTGEVLADRDAILSAEMAKDLWEAGVTEAYVRSPLACEAARGICRMCYGVMPATGKLVNRGDAAGIIAAQSIGEPGTQLTMRTFHTGGIAGVDITSGIPRVEELFEARVPKNHAILSQIDGTAEVIDSPEGKHIRIVSTEEYREEYPVEESYTVVVQTGDVVESGAQLAQPNGDGNAAEGEEILPAVARMPGTVSVSDGKVTVAWEEQEERTYLAPLTAHVVVRTGDPVKAGQELTAGQKNPHDILLIQGRDAVHDYIIEEVQKVYRFQGVSMHDKHIEIVIRQMMRKVRVDHQGDTELLPGEPVDRAIFDEANRRVLAEGGEPARATPMLLGITRASLGTESFLAAASFQETTRVLTEAAISGSVDHLTGLKENVIIGRLIPARMDLTEEGRERLGIVAEEEEARALAARMALDDVQHEIELEEFTALMAMDPVDAAFHDD
jgi:DNA-directed RNA polymerase subunit beta'